MGYSTGNTFALEGSEKVLYKNVMGKSSSEKIQDKRLNSFLMLE